MSDDDTQSSQDQDQQQKPASEESTRPGGEFKPITSQEELNDALKARLDRERAKFKDYADLKAKATKLDEIERANMSELEKVNGQLNDVASERDTSRQEALRLRKAIEHGLSLEDADLFLTGSDEDTLDAQAKRLATRAAEQAASEAERKKKNPIVPKEGTSTQSGTTTEEEDREFARSFFGGSS